MHCARFYLLSFMFMILIHQGEDYTFRCPSAVEWNIRASSICSKKTDYYCLLCPTTEIYECARVPGGGYVEGCYGLIQDRKGFKKIIAGSFTREECAENRYQPVIFNTNETSDCIYEKSSCNGEGQIIFNNGTGRTDRLCSCSYKNGYDFVNSIKFRFCSSSGYEDCSCYLKPVDVPADRFPTVQNKTVPDSDEAGRSRSQQQQGKTEISWTIFFTIDLYTKPFIEEWEEEDKKFVQTHVSKHVLECIQNKGCVTLTGSSGVGKSAIIRHVALQMKEKGYKILEIKYPWEIAKAYSRYMALCVIDDCCGRYKIRQNELDIWEKEIDRIKLLLQHSNTKIIIGCRLQVYNDQKFKALSLFKSCECNLQSEQLRLSNTEKQSIAQLYHKQNAIYIPIDTEVETFPLLCRLSEGRSASDIQKLFVDPFTVYETELDKMNSGRGLFKRCILALIVIFNNRLRQNLFTHEIDMRTQSVIQNTCEALKLNTKAFRLVFDDELESLTSTFLNRHGYGYSTIHDKLFDFLAYYFGKHMTACIINNADSSFIAERFSYSEQEGSDNLIIVIPLKYQQIYIERLLKDWSDGEVVNVLSSINMKRVDFRKIFLYHIRRNNIQYQEDIATMRDKRTGETVLFCNCFHGYADFVDWSLSLHVDINITRPNGMSPLFMACCEGHTVVVDMLLKKGAYILTCNYEGESPLYKACQKGHTEIVELLLIHGADINKCDNSGKSPLHMACQNGHTRLVSMLLNQRVDLNKCDDYGKSPLFMACHNGHTELVKMLLSHGADLSKCENKGKSPLYVACQKGHTEIVEMLLNFEADVNRYENKGISPFYAACQKGHTELVKMLLSHGADLSKCENKGKSPLYVACQKGHTEIVEMLLNFKADVNRYENKGISPFYAACQKCHTELVMMLLNCKADLNTYENKGKSPLYVACQKGHTEIVEMLLNCKADLNKCDNDCISPLWLACNNGHTEIVNILLKHYADVNKCNNHGASPLWKACENGHTKIVDNLLKHQADVHKCTDDGISPLSIAKKYGHTEIVSMLLNHNALDYDVYQINKECEDGHT